MNRLDKMLTDLLNDAEHPAKTIAREMERTGKKAVGCMLEFCPEELIYAGGMLPVGLWGADVELNRAKSYFPPFFCAPIQQSFELAAQGACDGVLSAVMVPILCDALKSAGQNWRVAVPQIPMIPVTYPQNRQLPSGQQFFRSELDSARTRLEQVGGRTIGEEELDRAIDLYNQYRQAMQDFAAQAALHADVITPRVRHAVFQCGFFRDKGEYLHTVRELTEQLKTLPETTGTCRVALTGIALDSPQILAAMEKHGLTVAADTLAQEYGQVGTLVPDGADGLTRLAGWWSQVRFSSLALDQDKGRVNHLVDLARSGAIDGVIVAFPTFCDPEEYDYPILRAALEQAGVPHVCLEINGRGASEQAESRLQAFAELMTLDQ